ncbi:inositol 1,4,5-trisphosphate receptor-interacting protein-like 1 [Rhineura floridana]|uniref:inositol 1,4,5-trisphosphate receptor-interacting protein-like 1 n=1 Tax=Rhineura floridana TaxID=261503 RepID=UPI002AC86AEA|nr:inositol 1,4,5-trisphosphate receptor-interacting protein-like 1 [Rhineura floridana]
MALGPLIFLAVVALVHHPLMVSDHTDSATLDRLQEHEKLMKKEMGHLETEFDQKGWSWIPSRRREDLVTTDLGAEDGTWDGWHYVGLVILILFGCCRHTIEKEPSYDSSTDSSSTTTSEDYDDMDMEPECDKPRQQMLETFYDQHVDVETSDLTRMCDFVETFVNDLLETCRKVLPYQNTLPLLENCIGVDSAFEGWHTQKGSKTFSVLVPVLPPKGHSFHIETTDSEDAPSKHGHILVEMECMCKRERLLGDVVCFLHHPEQEVSKDKQGAFLIHVLCTSSHLDVEKTIQWFQGLVDKAWPSICTKYNLDLTLQPSNTTCRLKLAFRSGRMIFIDITLGVQQGDSLVFLATEAAEMDHLTGTVWQKSFAIQELLFFKWVSQRAPEESCHLKCLQILIFFKESSPSDRKNIVLTNYHYKTCLMHLLLFQPLSDWGPEDFGPRLQDILFYMHTALQEKYLEHFLIGNISLPIHIPIPKALRSATPFNLFQHLAKNPNLHAEAMKEFVEVVQRVRALWSEHEE